MVVEADECNLLRYADPQFPGYLDGSEGKLVAGAQDGIGQLTPVENVTHGLAASNYVESRQMLEVDNAVKPRLPHRIPIPLRTRRENRALFRPSHMQDAFTSDGHEIQRRLLRRLLIVDANERNSGAQDRSRYRDDPPIVLRKLPQFGWEASVQKDKAVSGTRYKLPGEGKFPFFIVFRTSDNDTDIVFLESFFDAEDDFGMGEGGDIRNDDKDLIGAPGPKHARIVVRDISVFPRDICNSRTR
ncbi:hypothetical protein [Rhizobium sp. YS-1r]|uniref:hypothetical protein n=1 Tax=Rhizobium sp. YS-1r TaxID=1532558 RepID=UPI001FCABF9A|nr:hypothetical protein [Rhizobium sp. YS-1r]